MPEIASLPDLNDAMARLDAAEAAESGAAPAPEPILEQVDAPSDSQPPTPATEGSTPNSLPTDTPAAAEKKAVEPQKKSETQDQGSKFAKDKARRDDSWKALNAEKEATRREKEQIASEKAAIQRERQQWEQQRAKASAKPSPEQYEQYSQQLTERAKSSELQAKGLEQEARELEDEGKYPEAEMRKARARELREASVVDNHNSKQAKAQAEHIRKNPDPTEKQVQEQLEGARKEWTIKAAQAYPELAKEGSEFQKSVAGHLKALEKDAPQLLEFPGIIYHVARLTKAETDAARVPGLEKKLGDVTARVKELEAFTAPGGGTAAAGRVATDQQTLSEEDERDALRQMALQRS